MHEFGANQAMAEPTQRDTRNIDEVAGEFCRKLKAACALPKRPHLADAFAAWHQADLVDNPDPLGWRDMRRTLGQAPQGTFRYGMRRFDPWPHLDFIVSPYRQSAYRTPIEQAQEVALNASWVCWGAHMSNKARHIIPHAEGVPFYDGREFGNQLGTHLPWFIDIWRKTLRESGLRDANNGLTWFEGDELHVEFADSKISRSDSQAMVCVDEYVRLINIGFERNGKKARRNYKFEASLKLPQLKLRLKNLK